MVRNKMRKLLVLLLVQILLDSIRLPDNSSIFTAEAKAIDIALYHIRDQSEKQFIIYSDSLSVLKSLKDLHHTNPLIQQILKKYYYLSASKEIVFCWLPSQVNIRGNELADSEAKSALSLVITNSKFLTPTLNQTSVNTSTTNVSLFGKHKLIIN